MSDELVRPSASGLSHLGLSVSDLDRSIAFYRDVLGAVVVRPPHDGDSPSFQGRMALVGLGSLGVDLYEHTANPGDRFDPARTGLDHLALAVDSYKELEAWARWLDAHEVRRSPIRDGGGVGSMFDFTDPDGVQIEFYFLDEDKLRRSANFSSAATGNADAPTE